MTRVAALGPIVMLALTAGLWTALARLGFALPRLASLSPVQHGPLMVCGFIGTVIALERAVASGRRWAYLAPYSGALGALALLFNAPTPYPAAAFLLAAAAVIGLFVAFMRTQNSDFIMTMAAGAVFWFVGNLLWTLGWPISKIVPWWAGFLILTIAGERLELSRLRPRSARAQAVFWAVAAGYALSLGATLVWYDLGVRVSGLLLIVLSLWLVRHDVARATIRGKGLARYTAAAVLTGYGWLVVSGVLAMLFGGVRGGLAYDALLHSLFLGFVFVMIMAHAPIILPAVSGVTVPFCRTFYAPLALLHLSLTARVVGDLMPFLPLRMWSGAVNVAAVSLFFVVVIASVMAHRRTLAAEEERTPPTAPPRSRPFERRRPSV